jgi:ketosteroid isomerase-like protein
MFESSRRLMNSRTGLANWDAVADAAWTLRREADGSWKVVHEDTSARAGEGGKVLLRR